MLRPVAEPPDRPYEVALIRDPGHRRDEQLVGENNARGGQHRQIQFSALAHFLVGQAPGLRGTLSPALSAQSAPSEQSAQSAQSAPPYTRRATTSVISSACGDPAANSVKACVTAATISAALFCRLAASTSANRSSPNSSSLALVASVTPSL